MLGLLFISPPQVASLVVQRPGPFVVATYIHTNFLINAILKWGAWFQQYSLTTIKGIFMFRTFSKKKMIPLQARCGPEGG